MSKWIFAFADLMARPLSFIIIGGLGIIASAAGFVFGLGEGFMTLVNLSISMLTMIIGQAVLVSSRRDGLALHLKLDRIIEAQPTDNDAIGAEHQDTEVIQQAKDAVEHRAASEDPAPNFVVIEKPDRNAPRQRRRRRQSNQ